MAIYAGDGMLGLKLPSVLEVSIEGDRVSDLTVLDGVGTEIAPRLRERGYETLADLADAPRKDLISVERLSEIVLTRY